MARHSLDLSNHQALPCRFNDRLGHFIQRVDFENPLDLCQQAIEQPEVAAGELRIEFYGAEDLAAKPLELSKAMANDWPAFARTVEDGGKEAAVST